MIVGLAPPEGEEAEATGIEVELATDEPVGPARVDRIPDAEDRHAARVARAAQEDEPGIVPCPAIDR